METPAGELGHCGGGIAEKDPGVVYDEGIHCIAGSEEEKGAKGEKGLKGEKRTQPPGHYVSDVRPYLRIRAWRLVR